MRILIMAGGTGGHIFPALAVAKRLQAQGHQVQWIGTRHGMEAHIVPNNHIQLNCINIAGIRRRGWLALLAAPWQITRAIWQSIRILRQFKPDVVLGMGGYVTGPAGFAAWLLRKRLVIHEQNAVAGMTNQILAKFSYKVLEAFPHSFPATVKATVTGNPVREDFVRLLPPNLRPARLNGALKILILGGSGGARALNNIIPQVLKAWQGPARPQIWHQAGKKQLEEARQTYADCGFTLENVDQITLTDFIEDMPAAFTWADIVVCRAGALTIAELAAAGVASILIPYPYAVDDHQTKNAQFLAEAGAAIIIQERDLNPEKLRNLLQDFTQHPEQLNSMANAAYSCAKLDALERVVEQCVG